MSNIYSKNTILCGEIDFFCLLCEKALHYISDVESHIHWENHRKLLKNVTYIATFKNDFIMKIKNHYYCEVCNEVMPTLIKTALHIKDKKHIHNKQHPKTTNKGQTPVKRNGGAITISNITLSEREWNGIIDNQCVLCDLELNNIEEHMKSQTHLINLVQSKTEKSLEFYRKIGSDIFFCFTCKEPVFLAEMDSHWVSKEHVSKKKKMQNGQVNNGASCSSSSSESFDTQFRNNLRKMFDPPKNDITNESAIAKKLHEFKKENIDISFERSKATCKTCGFSPTFAVKDIQDHISMHKHAENQLQSESSENKENLYSNQESVKENQVLGKATEKKQKKTEYETKTLKQYVRSLAFFKEVDAFWINKTMAVERHSFKILCQNNGHYNDLKCYLCDAVFPSEQDKRHWQTPLHKERLLQTKVISSLKNEFVREFYSTEFHCNLFHCGFCNEVTPSYAAMKTHLESDDHQENKEDQIMMAAMIKDMDMIANLVCFKLMQSF